MSSDHNRPGRATAPYFIKEFGELGLDFIGVYIQLGVNTEYEHHSGIV